MVKIKIKEKKYTLNYNNKVLFDIEKKLDISIIKLFQNKELLERVHVIYTIIHCGIQEEIDFDEFCEMVSFEELSEVLPTAIEKITDGFNSGIKKK